MKKQKELDRLTKELVKQMTGNEVEDPQEGDYQIAYYYLSKAMDYTHCCKSDSEQLLAYTEFLREELHLNISDTWVESYNKNSNDGR